MSVHEFYRLKWSITLEQVNTTEWSQKRILISKIAMVGFCKLSLYVSGLVMSMRFIFGDDWSDVSCKSLLIFDLWQWCNFSEIEALEPATADVFPVVANTKSIQKQVKSIDVYKVGSKKPFASKSCFVSSSETQGQLVGTIEYSWWIESIVSVLQ